MKNLFRTAIVVLVAVSLPACSSKPYDRGTWGFGGAVAGAGIGAGTGAIIASSIANGDVAASALLGGAVGIPVGIVAGVAYADYKRHAPLRALKAANERNKETLKENDAEIARLREELAIESTDIPLDDSHVENVYVGPRLGAVN